MEKIIIHHEVSNCHECPFCHQDWRWIEGWEGCDYEITGYHCVRTEEELNLYEEDGINEYCPYKKKEE